MPPIRLDKVDFDMVVGTYGIFHVSRCRYLVLFSEINEDVSPITNDIFQIYARSHGQKLDVFTHFLNI